MVKKDAVFQPGVVISGTYQSLWTNMNVTKLLGGDYWSVAGSYVNVLEGDYFIITSDSRLSLVISEDDVGWTYFR